ncbi:hypothetical protein FRB96_003444 [Tulasnella sp. 330]|nr:hypothetical protein FRB96_003444 [Tulasnella sp. 330]KAG8888900.1 hypothetical protein FRB98_006442 [Tulasnella sp. 332]
MTSTSPTTNKPIQHDEEDRVVFKSSPPAGASATNAPTVFQKSSPTPIGAKRSSLGVLAPSQPPFSPSPLLLGSDVTPGGDQSWDLAEKLRQMQIRGTDAVTSKGQEAVFPNLNDDAGTGLAPAAEIQEKSSNQPHSRQSSNGTSSGVESPTIPTPGQGKMSNGTGSKMGGKSPYVGVTSPGGGEGGFGDYPYGDYSGQGLGMSGDGQTNGVPASAASHILQQSQQGGQGHPAGAHFSPINGSFPRLMQAALNSGAGQPQPTSQYPAGGVAHGGFGFHSPPPPQTNELSGFMNGQNVASTFGSPNGAQRTANPAAFQYGSPPNGYPAGIMSPTITSPTFLPAGLNPYATPVMSAANPYGAYGAANGAGYDMSSPQGTPGSPLLAAQSPYGGRQPAFAPTAQYGRGRGQAPPTSPATMRGAAAMRGGAARSPRGRGGPAPMMSPAAYSSPYGPPMSPTPYDGSAGYGQQQQQQQQQQMPLHQQLQVLQPQATNPELASLMIQMAAAGYQQGVMSSPYAQQNAMAGGNGAMPLMNVNVGTRPDWMDAATWEMVQTQMGPSANNRKLGLYKTELCRSFEEKGECRYGDKCQFAHGEAEQRRVDRHPKYKTEICRTFWVSGSCPYGKRCCFIHTELPTNATANGNGPQENGQGNNTASGQNVDRNNSNNHSGTDNNRNRSMSTNSDPNDAPSSLLARISAKAQANSAAAAAASIARSSEASPANTAAAGGQPTEAVVAAAINRAMAKFGAPDPSVRKIDHPSPPVEVVPMPKAPAVFSNFPVGNATTTTSTLGVGGSGGGGGHHRMSASVDFGRVSRNLGSDLAAGFGGGGHARNPSASSVVPNSLLSRSPNPPLSGHSSPYGASSTPNNGMTSNGIQTSTLLDRTWA